MREHQDASDDIVDKVVAEDIDWISFGELVADGCELPAPRRLLKDTEPNGERWGR
jgi:hypothetical protein